MALTAKEIQHAKEGMHADGNGLYLRVQASGVKSWIFRYQLNGRRREMGLGALVSKSAPDARVEAAEFAKLVHSKIDPIDLRRQESEKAAAAARQSEAASVTFRMVAADYISTHKSGWKNAKHADQWKNTLETYAHPIIGDKPISDVTTEDVIKILSPIWKTKTETASRVRSRLELVLSFGKAKKLREGENPATWRGHLDAVFPKPGRVKPVRHYPALPYVRMSAFMKKLRDEDGIGARALEFAILTAARSGEVRLAKWPEFDMTRRVWTVPAPRMKSKREHRVPLSDAAISLLESLPKIEGYDYVFIGDKKDKPLSDMTLAAVIKRMNAASDKPIWIEDKTGRPAVPHGLRSSFRDWAAEITHYPREMAEMALAHTVDNKVEAAYRRGDMFEKRRSIMQDWAAWCD